VNEIKRRLLLDLAKVFDLGLVSLAFACATLFIISKQGSHSAAAFLSMRVKLVNLLVFGVFLLLSHGCLTACGLYASRRSSPRFTEIVDCVKAATLTTMIAMFLAIPFEIEMITPVFFGTFWLLLSVLLGSTRLGIRYFLGRVRRRGRNLRNVVILGTNRRAMEFATKVATRPEWGYRVLGFVDDKWVGPGRSAGPTLELCCDLKNVAEFLRCNVVDEVAIYLPLRSFHGYVSEVAALCELHGISMRLDCDIFNLKLARFRADTFDGDPLIRASTGRWEGWPVLAKRALDCSISFVLLVLFAPLFAVVALLIKATSEGPVLFSQERVGLNKRRFRIWKFRTMVPNAEVMLREIEGLNEVSGPVFKIKNDPRVTPLGRWLRRTSIDELPQLLNVLKGEMSLVGPRPLPLRDYEGFSEDWQRRRFSVRPGITCLWQIKGRNTIPFDQWMELDLQYLDQWSFWLDLRILVRTIQVVVTGVGAA
jgi:exopolysaccharide biosynthesis polyprenyl glycosylphosphotransferase